MLILLFYDRYFRDKDFATASQHYSRAVELCPRGDEHKEALVSSGSNSRSSSNSTRLQLFV